MVISAFLRGGISIPYPAPVSVCQLSYHSLALVGAIEGALPGHENQEILVAVLGYVVAFLSLLCGIACVKGISGLAKGLGFLFAVAGLASLIYLQVTQDAFSIFDCLAVCFGVSIMFFASKK